MRAALLPLLLTACISTKSDSGDPSGGVSLNYYTTCGDPVCNTYNASAHTNAPCTSETEGASCSPEGAGCDLQDDCNTELICATEDPKLQEGGCPISLRAAKTEIRYLGAADTQALHRELMSVKLADYRYKTEPAGQPHHLGFIIDDQRVGSPMVLPSGERVDLYGYTSMAVAALQVQEQQLAAQQALLQQQQAELAELKARLAALEAQAQKR